MKISKYRYYGLSRKVILLASILLAGNLFPAGEPVFSEQQYTSGDEQPTVVAPGSLTETERTALRSEYTYQVRNKDLIAVPYQDSAISTQASSRAPAPPERYESEGDEYRSYLGTAIDLYKDGELEKAAKIFQYLNVVDPKDDYVRSYLSRIKREIPSNKARWNREAEFDAAALKSRKMQSLLRDGEEFYKSGDFDGALVKFKDVLSMDPDNRIARSYIKKLKAYYSVKTQAREVVRERELARSAASGGTELGKEADRMLDEKEVRRKETAKEPADEILDDAEMKKAPSGKDINRYLDDAELEYSVEGIAAEKRAQDARATEMILGTGDRLRLKVLGNPELSGDVTIKGAGTITLPLTGDKVKAQGLTITELTEKVRQVMDEYIQSPDVMMSIIKLRSQLFYVLTDTSCRPYPIFKPNLTLREALFLADWGSGKALGRVIVMKPSAHRTLVKKVDAFNLMYRGDLTSNMPISNGDVIYIPMTYAAKITKTIWDTLQPIAAIQSAKYTWLDLKWNTADWENYFREPENYDQMSQSVTTGGYGGGYGVPSGPGYLGAGGGGGGPMNYYEWMNEL